jgi:hypothetical protein
MTARKARRKAASRIVRVMVAPLILPCEWLIQAPVYISRDEDIAVSAVVSVLSDQNTT